MRACPRFKMTESRKKQQSAANSTAASATASPPSTPPPLLIEESPSPPTLAASTDNRRPEAQEASSAPVLRNVVSAPYSPAIDDPSIIVIRDDEDDDDDDVVEEVDDAGNSMTVATPKSAKRDGGIERKRQVKGNFSTSASSPENVQHPIIPIRSSTPPSTKVDLDKLSSSASSCSGSSNSGLSPIKGYGGAVDGDVDSPFNSMAGGSGAWINAKGPSMMRNLGSRVTDDGPMPIPPKPCHGLPVGNGKLLFPVFACWIW